MSGRKFSSEDGPEDVCGGQCNVECLERWAPGERLTEITQLAQHHRDRLTQLRAEIDAIAEQQRKRLVGVVL